MRFATKMIDHLCPKIQNDRASSRSKRATKMIEVENFCHQNDRSSHTSHPHNYYTFVTHRHSRVRVGQLVCGRFSNVLNKLWVLLLCFEQLLNKFESGFCGSSAWGLHALIELGTSTALRRNQRFALAQSIVPDFFRHHSNKAGLASTNLLLRGTPSHQV